VYERVEYAGNIFKTTSFQAKHTTKHDDSHFRMDHLDDGGEKVPSYATLSRIIVHELYPDGPSKIFVEGVWFTNLEKCDITGNPILGVDQSLRNHLNYQAKFAILEDCYQKPVAIWPHDPLRKKGSGHADARKYEAIDNN
jgi:hypothetical protein